MKCLGDLVVEHVNTVAKVNNLMPIVRKVATTYFQETQQIRKTSRVNSLTQWFTTIHNQIPEGPVLIAMKIINKSTEAEKKLKIDAYMTAVLLKNRHPVELHWSQVASVITRSIASPEWFDQIIAVELAIGARSIEIMSTSVSNFEQAFDENNELLPNHIRQIGVAKDRDEDQERLIQKPILLLTFDQVITAILKVREHIGDDYLYLKNAELTSKYNAKISLQQKKNWPGAFKQRGRLGSHFSREVYANTSFVVLDHEPMSKNAWIASVLGHKTGSISTSLSYTGVVIARDVGPTVEQTPAAIESLKAELEALRNTGTEAKISVASHEAIFFTEDGTVVKLKKFKRKRNLTDVEQRKKVKKGENMLKTNHVLINHNNLRALGMGAVMVSKYKSV
jgi:hypothetical protein